MTEIREVRLRAPSSNTTQDFTIPGFGTPDAVFIRGGGSGNSGSWAGNAYFSAGFYDGSNQRSVGYGVQNNQDPNTSQSQTQQDNAYVLNFKYDNTVRRRATVTFITDGVRLSWSDATANQPWVTVMLIKGINGAQSGNFTSPASTTLQVSTPGMTPKLILFLCRASGAMPGSGGFGRYSFGFALDDGVSIKERCHGFRHIHATTNDLNSSLRDDGCCSITMSAGGSPNLLKCSAMAADSFTVFTSTTDNDEISYLALDFDEDVIAFTADTPTAPGNWRPFTSTFEPQYVCMICTSETAMNTNRSSGQMTENFGLYGVVGDGNGSFLEESGHYMFHQDAVSQPSNIQADDRADTRFEINNDAGGSPQNLVNGNTPNFDATGIEYLDANFSHDSTAYKVPGFAIAAASSPNQPPVVDTPIPDQVCTVGQPFGPLDVSGNFSDPDSDPLTFTASGLPNGLTISAAGVISGTPTGGFQP